MVPIASKEMTIYPEVQLFARFNHSEISRALFLVLQNSCHGHFVHFSWIPEKNV